MDLLAALTAEFRSRTVMDEKFPMLTRHGIADTDVTVHSHFLSYLAALGDTFGYSGIFECPIPTTPSSTLHRLGEVRPDGVWFTKADNQPVAAFEFERFGPGQEAKLRTKMENLHIAWLQSERKLHATVLIYWVRSGVAPNAMRELVGAYHTGFVRRGVQVRHVDSPLAIFKCTWRTAHNGLVVSDILPVETT